MDVKPVKTEADYETALAEIDALFDAEPETPEGDRLEVLLALVKAYEDKHWPLDIPDAVDAIRFRMQTHGLTQSDLAKLLGSRSRASEILARKRALTIEQAHRLHHEWNIPAESLLAPSPKS
jgi:HTH-type transcriptional regulator/antitoxin HigA